MATTIITKNGSGAPTTDDLSTGELAIDLTNKRLYSYDGTSVIELGVNTASSLNVTGTVTADGLTVDTDTLVVDATNNRVGIGTTTPNVPVDAQLSGIGGLPVSSGTSQTYGSLRVGATSFNTILDMGTAGGTGAWLQASDRTGLGTNYSLLLNPNGGNVGIGTSSPVASSGYNSLTINATTSGYLVLQNNGTTKMEAYVSGGTEATLRGTGVPLAFATTAAHDMTFDTNATERMRIDSSGNVGIGTDLPGNKLVVKRDGTTDGTNAQIVSENRTGAAGQYALFANSFDNGSGSGFKPVVFGAVQTAAAGRTADFIIAVSDTDNVDLSTDERLRINSSGNVGIGASPNAPLHVKGTTNGNLYVRAASLAEGTLTGTALSSVNDAASATVPLTLEGSEFNFVQSNAVKVKVDTSGNFLVGTTSSASSTAGIKLTAAGTATFVRDGVQPVYINRLTSDGNLAVFAKDGTTVGSIGSVSFGVAGISFVNPTYGGIRTADYRINPVNGSGADFDNSIDLGAGGNRFKNLYLSGDLALTESFVFGNTDGLNLRANSGKVISMQIAGSEKARIDSSGNFLVGRTSVAGSATDYGMQVYSSGLLYLYANASGDDDIFRGHNSAGTNTSAIEADGDYIDLSDSRFKENIVDAPSVINTIKNIPVRSFDWKDRSYGQTYGFIAQELNGVCPEVVKVPKSEEDVWGVKNSKVVPMLVKAIQEQQDLIESLTARIAALEGAN